MYPMGMGEPQRGITQRTTGGRAGALTAECGGAARGGAVAGGVRSPPSSSNCRRWRLQQGSSASNKNATQTRCSKLSNSQWVSLMLMKVMSLLGGMYQRGLLLLSSKSIFTHPEQDPEKWRGTGKRTCAWKPRSQRRGIRPQTLMQPSGGM